MTRGSVGALLVVLIGLAALTAWLLPRHPASVVRMRTSRRTNPVAPRPAAVTPQVDKEATRHPQATRAPSSPAPWPAAPALPPVEPAVITLEPTEPPAVALTLDACETSKPAGYDAAIIRILRDTQTPATLFLGGKWMESHPDETRDLAADPLFELGNHSYLHPHLRRLSESQIRTEIQRTQDVMFGLTGTQGTLFRAPFGEYDDRVLRIAAELGLTTVQWDVVSGDPDRKVTASRMINAVIARARNGSVIIMHVNGRGWHTAEALPTVIAKLKAAGYAFLTVSDLVRAASPHPLRP